MAEDAPADRRKERREIHLDRRRTGLDLIEHVVGGVRTVRVFATSHDRPQRTSRRNGESPSPVVKAQRGPYGPPGPAGRRLERGLGGETSDQVEAPIDVIRLLSEVNEHIETIYRELDVQLIRMAQIQQQVDELRGKVKTVSE